MHCSQHMCKLLPWLYCDVVTVLPSATQCQPRSLFGSLTITQWAQSSPISSTLCHISDQPAGFYWTRWIFLNIPLIHKQANHPPTPTHTQSKKNIFTYCICVISAAFHTTVKQLLFYSKLSRLFMQIDPPRQQLIIEEQVFCTALDVNAETADKGFSLQKAQLQFATWRGNLP